MKYTDITLSVMCPPLMAGDARIEKVFLALEGTLAVDPLEWTVSPSGSPKRVSDRMQFVSQALEQEGRFPLVCNHDEERLVSILGQILPAWQAPGGTPMSVLQVTIPQVFTSRAPELIERLGDAAEAWHAHAISLSAGAVIRDKVYGGVVDLSGTRPNRPGEDKLRLPKIDKNFSSLKSPAVPNFIGWINHWSKDTAEALGFAGTMPDSSFPAPRLLPTGAWIVSSPMSHWICRATITPMRFARLTHSCNRSVWRMTRSGCGANVMTARSRRKEKSRCTSVDAWRRTRFS